MNLKTYLSIVGMTMKDFADLIQCDPKYLSRVLNGPGFAGKRLVADIERATGGVVKMPSKDRPRKKQVPEEVLASLVGLEKC